MGVCFERGELFRVFLVNVMTWIGNVVWEMVECGRVGEGLWRSFVQGLPDGGEESWEEWFGK